MIAVVAMLSCTARRAVGAIRYKYQISAAAQLALYRPTALNCGRIHSAHTMLQCLLIRLHPLSPLHLARLL